MCRSDLSLVGAYSRFGWSHPGPAQFLLLGIPYRLLGSVSAALLAGTILLHLAAGVGSWLLARAVDATAGAFVLLAQLALVAAEAPSQVSQPWNPYVSLVGTGLLLVAAWSSAELRVGGLVILLPVATLLVQAHIGAAPIALAAVSSGLTIAVVRAVRGARFPWAPPWPWAPGSAP